MRPRLELLAADEVERIVGEACRVLERVGVLVENAQAAELLQAGGAERRDDRIRIAEAIVRAALATAPSRFALFDRSGELTAELGAGRTHFDPGSAAIHLVDRQSGRRRPATSGDLVELARLVDALPHFAAQATSLVASDVPDAFADRWRLYLALRFCAKPVVTGTFRKESFAPMHAMLAAVRGGDDALRERPLALFDCCPTSPLTWSDLTAQALLDAARAGVPANLIAVPMTGATAPVTLHGALVQLAAENLSGVVLHQLAAPGAPLVWGGAPSAFDMRQGAAVMGAIESAMLNVANAQVGRALALPTHGYLALSDAKTPDYQAGLESGAGALLGALGGIDLVSGPGLLDFLLTQSLEKILLDHEACGVALRLQRGLEPHADDVASLLGELVGAREMLSHPHTRRHWRQELSIPSRWVDRASYGDWQAAGARSAVERAREEVERHLAAPSAPLSGAPAEALEALLAADAERSGVGRLPVF